MAEIIETGNGTHQEYASNSKANAALATGIVGTSLGALSLLGNHRGGLLGGLFGQNYDHYDNDNYGHHYGRNGWRHNDWDRTRDIDVDADRHYAVNNFYNWSGGNGLGYDSRFIGNGWGNNHNGWGYDNRSSKSDMVASMTAEDLYIERDMCNKYLDITKQYYENKLEGNRQLTDAFFACYDRDVKNSFDLYKMNRDNKDELNEKINSIDKKVDMMMAVRPYQDALINAKIDKNALIADYNLSRRTCRMIQGELVLPNDPTVTGYVSYNSCGGNN